MGIQITKAIKVDEVAASVIRGQFARARMEIDFNKPLVPCVRLWEEVNEWILRVFMLFVSIVDNMDIIVIIAPILNSQLLQVIYGYSNPSYLLRYLSNRCTNPLVW